MAERDLRKCKLDLVGVQEVRWEKDGTEWAIIHFSIEKGMRIISYEVFFLYLKESHQQLEEWSLLVIRCHL
jgi:hypothetical protein